MQEKDGRQALNKTVNKKSNTRIVTKNINVYKEALYIMYKIMNINKCTPK